MAKTIELPNTNLYLNGAGKDINGNRVIKISFPNSKAFSIQVSGNLPKTKNLISGLNTINQLSKLSYKDLEVISKEVGKYVFNFGSASQKNKFKVY